MEWEEDFELDWRIENAEYVVALLELGPLFLFGRSCCFRRVLFISSET